jgi:hypothetical protein
MPAQELSIRDREQELFVEPQDTLAAGPPVKPFPVYLRETPGNPLSTGVRVILWIVGIAVLLLFGAALLRTQRPTRLRRTSSATKAAVLDATRLWFPPPDAPRGVRGYPGSSS